MHALWFLLSRGRVSDPRADGYENHVWEAMEKLKATPTIHAESQPNHSQSHLSSNLEQSTPNDQELVDKSLTRIKIKLRGAWGECRLGVQPTTTSTDLLEYYRKKYGKDGEGIHLVFDGEKVEGNKSVAEMGIDDQDLVDVEGC
jgi:hypothetical protein